MSNQSKHTPGPWKLSHETGNGFNVSHEIAPQCGHLLVVAECTTQKPYLGHEITRETAEANARLIAATPELLKACILFENLTRNGQPVGSEDLEMLQAAIAKAEGR